MITQERLKEVLDYNPETGDFRWKVQRPGIKPGDVAGCISTTNSYRMISVDRNTYLAHRLAFLYMTGEFPPEQCDHIDHNRRNNKWDNLRAVSRLDNQRNASLRHDNTSGVTGIYWHKRKGKWHVQIKAGDRRIHIGYYDKLEAAYEARKHANSNYGYHENHGAA